MDEKLTWKEIVENYIKIVKKLFGDKIKSIILFGSYARGDFREDSDIDIAILLDMSVDEVCEYREELSCITYDFNEKYHADVVPIELSYSHFNEWLGVYPFYDNVHGEGVKLYG